jgi:hypothetical protein
VEHAGARVCRRVYTPCRGRLHHVSEAQSNIGSHTLGLLLFIEQAVESNSVVVLFLKDVVGEALSAELVVLPNEVLAERPESSELTYDDWVFPSR